MSIAQDSMGFMWFGTDDGLYRYDGYTLKPYRHDPKNPSSLSDNTIKVVYRDRAGTLWIGMSYGGLDRFDPAHDTFTHYQHDPNDSRSLSDQRLNCIYEDSAGSLWVGTQNGLNRLDAARGQFVNYPSDVADKSRSDDIQRLYEDHQHNLWVGTTKGLKRLDRRTGRIKPFPDGSVTSYSLGPDYVGSITEDLSGVLWLGSPLGSGLSALDPNTGELTQYAFNSNEPWSPQLEGVNWLRRDANGAIWVATLGDGLFQFDPADRHLTRYSNLTVASFFQDAEGNVWLGTHSGVGRFQMTPPSFVNYLQDAGNPGVPSKDAVLAVREDSSGLLWIGTARGLVRLDRRTGQTVRFRHDPQNPTSLSNDVVEAIVEDGAGGLWIGTHGGGLDHFDRASGRFRTYRHDPRAPDSLSSDLIQCLLFDTQGVLWVGTHTGGLNRFDPVTHKFRSYRNDPRDVHSLSNDNVRALFEDRAGTLWVATNYGLNRLDRGSEQFIVYLHDSQNPSSLSHNSVGTIYEDRTGSLWIGTRSGLGRLDRARGIFTTFTTHDGLANDAIESIREDNRGNLWLATHEGISELSPSTKAVHNYSEADGLPGNFDNPGGPDRSCVTANGEIVFGSNYGLTVFDPAKVSANSYVPPVVLTDFLLFNRSILPGDKSPLRQAIWSTRTLTLDHSQNIFTVEFAGLSFVAPERNRYRYRLERLEEQWNEVDSKRRMGTYTSLPAGTYVFRVQASNNSLVWNETGASLTIRILPPWWETWWFRALVGLCCAGSIFTVHLLRVRGLRSATVRLELQVAERTRELALAKESAEMARNSAENARNAAETANRAKSAFLSNMSHEFRTPLNAILGFARLLKDEASSEKQRADLDVISRSGEHLLALVNDTLDVAKIEAGRATVNISCCDLTGLIDDVTAMIRVRASAKGLALHLVQSSGVPRFVNADGPKLSQVLINLLDNAVKFTAAGSVTLRLDARRVSEARGLLLIAEVEDTGIGIAPEDQERIFEAFVRAGRLQQQKGTGLGLSIARQFVQLMGGTIRLDSAPGRGSLFHFEVPVELVEESDATIVRGARRQIIGLKPGQPEYRILIVEDRQENWIFLQRLLQGAGFKVRVAEDGVQGIEVFQTWRPNLICMDLRLPVLGGLEAARKIRAMESGAHVKIVAVTASALAHQQAEVLSAGFDDFVRKPYRPEEIFDCMARHLGARYLYRESQEASGHNPSAVMQPRAFGKLPSQLRKELANALVRLDPGPIDDVIRLVSEKDKCLGEALTLYSKRFAYTEILQVLEQCDSTVAGDNNGR